MADAVRAILAAGPRVAAKPETIVGVGGTASNLLKLLPEALVDLTVTRPRLAAMLHLLATMPAAELTERYRVNPVRARLLPAGAAIVRAILDRHSADAMHVSRASLREGAVLAVQHAGPCWRDRLPVIAQGWRV
jgi:exopolyphosphatase/pppGpp-phosphohydrolase